MPAHLMEAGKGWSEHAHLIVCVVEIASWVAGTDGESDGCSASFGFVGQAGACWRQAHQFLFVIDAV